MGRPPKGGVRSPTRRGRETRALVDGGIRNDIFIFERGRPGLEVVRPRGMDLGSGFSGMA